MLGRSALLAATNVVDYGNWLGNYSDVSLLLRNGTPQLVPLDESPTPKAITAVGNASVTTAQFRYGTSSLTFDSTDDRLTLASSNDFAFGTGDFTIEFWMRSQDVSTATQRSILQISQTAGGMSGDYTGGILIYQGRGVSIGQNGAIAFFIGGSFVGSPVVLTVNTWHHVALTRAGSTCRMFVDGSQVSTLESSLNLTASNLVVGGGNTGLYQGQLDDLRITKGIARYVEGTGANATKMVFAGTNNLADPNTFGELQTNTGPNPDPSYNSVSLLLRGNETLGSTLVPFDESPIATRKTITTSGAAAITTTAGDWKYTGSAISLTKGTNSFIQAGILNDPAFDFGSGDFTIEAWIKPSTVSGTNPVVSNMTGPFAAEGWMLFIGSGALRFNTYNNSGSPTVAMTGGSVSLNVYQHIAVTRSSTTLRLFLGGNQVATPTTISGNLITTNAFSKPLRVGRSAYTGQTDDYGGFIDDLRITKGIARYTSNFTPPPTELPNF